MPAAAFKRRPDVIIQTKQNSTQRIPNIHLPGGVPPQRKHLSRSMVMARSHPPALDTTAIHICSQDLRQYLRRAIEHRIRATVQPFLATGSASSRKVDKNTATTRRARARAAREGVFSFHVGPIPRIQAETRGQNAPGWQIHKLTSGRRGQ